MKTVKPGRIDLMYSLHYLEQAGPAGDTIGLQRRGYREAYGLLSTGGISDYEIRRKRIPATPGTLRRGIVRLQIYSYIYMPCHESRLLHLFFMGIY